MHNHIQKTPDLHPGCFYRNREQLRRENVAMLTDAETPLSSCYRCELPEIERGSNTDAYCPWPERPPGMPLWPGRRGAILGQVVQGRKWVLSVCSQRSTASSALPSAWCHGGCKYLLKLALLLSLVIWHCRPTIS